MLPSNEICAGLRLVAETHMGVTREDAITEASRLFGFKATSVRLRDVMAPQITRLLEQGELVERNERLFVR